MGAEVKLVYNGGRRLKIAGMKSSEDKEAIQVDSRELANKGFQQVRGEIAHMYILRGSREE